MERRGLVAQIHYYVQSKGKRLHIILMKIIFIPKFRREVSRFRSCILLTLRMCFVAISTLRIIEFLYFCLLTINYYVQQINYYAATLIIVWYVNN